MEHSSPKITLEDLDRAPAEISSEPANVDPAFLNRLQDDFTRVSEEKDNLQLELDRVKRDNKTNDILDSLIEPFAERTFLFMCSYCSFVGFILVLHVSGWTNKELPESVLQVLVGSTAATVIGLVGMVLTGVFVGARKKLS